ncbi:MAG TPA: S8 family serine peptidase [Candidatus Thermoplasmatota archaeon]|nr:S8 family serine peptidase [Candidatus Thermoplasmatota archaeon]
MPRAPVLCLLVLLVAPCGAADGGSPQRALLSLPPGVTAADIEAAGVRVLEDFAFAHVVLAEGAPSALAARLASVGAKAYPVEPVGLNLAESRALVGADALPIPVAEAGAGVAVAFVDSGVDETHPALRDRVVAHVRVGDDGVRSATGDTTGHGTHVAGILAGNGAGSEAARLRGLAPAARLVAVDISGGFTTTNAIRAFRWISEHADEHDIRVVSNSWGREKEGARYDEGDPLTRAADALVEQGIVVVFSAGNRGPGPSTLTQEAMDPSVLTVGATDKHGRLEDYSARGPALRVDGTDTGHAKPDLVAPGTGIVSTRAGGGYVVMNGTSMAAPHAAAAAAVLLARFPDLGPAEVRAVLVDASRASALDVGASLDALASERRVIVERRVPVSLAGEAANVAGRAVAFPDAVPARAAPSLARLDVPPGASALDLTARWEGVAPQGVRIVLAHEGRTVLEDVATEGPVPIHVDDPSPGEWTLLVEPRGAAGRTAWNAEGALTLTELQESNGTRERGLEKGSDPGAFRAPGAPARHGWSKVVMLTGAFAMALGVVGVRRRS